MTLKPIELLNCSIYYIYRDSNIVKIKHEVWQISKLTNAF